MDTCHKVAGRLLTIPMHIFIHMNMYEQYIYVLQMSLKVILYKACHVEFCSVWVNALVCFGTADEGVHEVGCSKELV